MKDQQYKRSFRQMLYSDNINDFNIAVQAMFSRAHKPCLLILIESLNRDDEDLFVKFANTPYPRYYDELYCSYLQDNSVLIQNFQKYLMYVCYEKIVVQENTRDMFFSIFKSLEYICKRYEHEKGIIVIAETAKKYKPSLFTILLYTMRKIYFAHMLIVFNKSNS